MSDRKPLLGMTPEEIAALPDPELIARVDAAHAEMAAALRGLVPSRLSSRPCPVVRGARPPLPDPECSLDTPEHKHVCVGPLEFCYRLTAQAGWTYEGCFAAGTEHQLDEGRWRLAFREARNFMTDRLAGIAQPPQRTGCCPDCGQVFAAPPRGSPPHLWTCAVPHEVYSLEGTRTVYGAGGLPVPESDE